jgi:hypothetical protein
MMCKLSIKGSKGGCPKGTSGDKATVTGEGKTGTEKYQVRKSVMQKEDEDEKGKTKDEAKSRKERGLYKH